MHQGCLAYKHSGDLAWLTAWKMRHSHHKRNFHNVCPSCDRHTLHKESWGEVDLNKKNNLNNRCNEFNWKNCTYLLLGMGCILDRWLEGRNSLELPFWIFFEFVYQQKTNNVKWAFKSWRLIPFKPNCSMWKLQITPIYIPSDKSCLHPKGLNLRFLKVSVGRYLIDLLSEIPLVVFIVILVNDGWK